MQAEELKSLVESGHYKPDPSRVAAAMLRRRGVRELLTGGIAGSAELVEARRLQQSPRRAA